MTVRPYNARTAFRDELVYQSEIVDLPAELCRVCETARNLTAAAAE